MEHNDLSDWANVQFSLGVAHRDSELGKHEDNIAECINCFKNALTVYTPDRPNDHRRVQIALGNVYLNRLQWSEASAAFHGAIAVDDVLGSAAITFAGSQAEFKAIHSAYFESAYCLLKLGAFEEAFLMLEKGKARMLARSFALPEATDHGSSGSEPSEDGKWTKMQLEAELGLRDIVESRSQVAEMLRGSISLLTGPPLLV